MRFFPAWFSLAIALGAASTASARPLENEFPDMMTCWDATLGAAELKASPRRQVIRVMLVHYPHEWKPDAVGRFPMMLKVAFRDFVQKPDAEDDFDFSVDGLCGADGDTLACRATDGGSGSWRIERAGGALTLRTVEPISLFKDVSGAKRTISPQDDPEWRLEKTPYGACQI